MDPNCSCNPKSSIIPEVHKINVHSEEAPSVEVDFGKIPFTNKKSKQIILDLAHKDTECFEIRSSDEDKRHLDVFFITPSEVFHKKGNPIKLRCTYKPSIPFRANLEKFILYGSNFTLSIYLKGESTGPILTVSANYVKFFQYPRQKNGRAVVEIRNKTNIPAPFSMEIDSKQKLFTVTPLYGICTDLTFVVINFNPPENFGEFGQQLNCLVYGNRPIVIHIVGVYSKRPIYPDKASIIYYPFPLEEKIGYRGCFASKIKQENNPYPISLNTYYLDLGRVILNEEESSFVSKNFYLTNNLDYEVTVNWIEDDKVFNIFPKKITVDPGESMIFKCIFTPIYEETCYNRMFSAQVTWKYHNIEALPTNENVITVPLTVSVNLQGHSFREDQMPLGHLEFMPPIIEFPPALLGQINYLNFKIINRISRPVMFKLVPPSQSQVIMTPMAGMITDFIVILANFECSGRAPHLDEHWHVILNGQDQKKIPFNIRGSTEVPSIKIGNTNEVHFHSVQINTVATQTVLIHNTSNFNIYYQFIMPEQLFISVQPSDGIVQMCRDCPVKIIFKANPCAPSKNILMIKMHVENVNELSGPSFDHFFTVYTDTTYSELSATPLTDEFHLVEYGTVINTSFHIYNFGASTVFFRINPYFKNKHVKINPVIGQVEPSDNIKVDVKVECEILGLNHIKIEYHERQDAESEDCAEEAKLLMEFYYECNVSILKITEIVEHTFGPLFSKRHFWRFLKINNINNLLDNMRPGQTESMEVDLPECLVGSHHYITFLIENNTDLDTAIQLKRKQLCNCSYKPTQSAYRIEYILDCVHRTTISMEITQENVNRRSSQMITIDVKYVLPGKTIMGYEVFIRPYRKIILYFTVFGIPHNVGRISVYRNDFYMKMLNGALGARRSPAQIFWFYNNSSISSKIGIDLSNVNKINNEYKFKVFECFFDEIYVKPQSIWPLMIRFCPIEEADYKIEIMVRMNKETKIITIEGKGVLTPLTEEFFSHEMPLKCTTSYKFPLKFSNENLIVKYLPIWNYIEKVILMQNVTKGRLIFYEWADFYVYGLIKITANEKSGILRPGTSKTITIKIESYNESVLSNFVLVCSVMDIQLLYAHKKIQAMQEIVQKETDDEIHFIDYPIHYKSKNPNNHRKTDMPSREHINYIMSVNISINIVDRLDLNIFLSKPTDIFTFSCPETFNPNMSISDIEMDSESSKKCHTDEFHEPQCDHLKLHMVENIFEKVISDIVFNDTFPQIISSIFEDYPLYYSQLNLDDRPFNQKLENDDDEHLEEVKQIEVANFLSRPTMPVLAETFKSLIKDSLNKILNLRTQSEQEADEKVMKNTMEHLSELCTINECECPTDKV